MERWVIAKNVVLRSARNVYLTAYFLEVQVLRYEHHVATRHMQKERNANYANASKVFLIFVEDPWKNF
jgi:hypothetical protein